MTLENPAFANGKRVTIKGLVRQLLKERIDAVRTDPSLKITDRWTLSTVFYRVRPRILQNGLSMSDTIRGTIEYEYINDICTEELGVRRRDLGIFAAVRAQLYFRGKVFNVILEEVDALAGKGTDIIIIEKEAIAEILSSFAAKHGIAILNPRGFLTENAEELHIFQKNLVEILPYSRISTLLGLLSSIKSRKHSG